MKRFLAIPALAIVSLALPAQSAADPGGSRDVRTRRATVYESNPYVSIGALRLDVRRDPVSQIPEGWRHADAVRVSARPDPYRLVKFKDPVGSRQRASLAAAGYAVVGYHPFNAFLVRPEPGEMPAALSSVEGVSWSGPFHPYFKIADALVAALEAADTSRFVIVESDWGLRFNIRLHEDDSRPVVETSVVAAPGFVKVFPTSTLPIRVQVDPKHFAAFLQGIAALPEVVVIEPWLPVRTVIDENVQTGQSGSCVEDGVEAPNTSVFNRGCPYE